MKQELNKLKTKVDNLLKLFDESNGDTDQEQFFDLELEANQLSDYQFNESELEIFYGIKKTLKQIRSDYDLYDEEAEREAMFPNGEDD
jgi:hypothetical protein